MKASLNIILSGGGTGGHIYPALAIARSILEIQPNAKILFVGANGRMEMEKIPAAGFTIRGIDIIGLQRKINLKNFFLPFYLLKSIQQVKHIFRAFQPDMVIGTGGYVSFPVLLMAQLQNIPSYIQEQNAYAGLANKLLAKRAKKIFVAFENMEMFFPKDKIVFAGNPVRNDLLNLNKEKALQHFQLNSAHPVVLVLGGSLGAKSINEAILGNIEYFIQNRIQLIWQMGKNFYSQLSFEVKKKLEVPNVVYKEFIYEMDKAYAAADVIISRAGASTIAELSVVSKPSILIPSPNVTDDHQTKNAQAMVHQHAALMIKDTEVNKQLMNTLDHLLKNKTLQDTLSQNIQKFSKPEASKNIAQIILQDFNHNSALS